MRHIRRDRGKRHWFLISTFPVHNNAVVVSLRLQSRPQIWLHKSVLGRSYSGSSSGDSFLN
jgi:hypothetical protein